MGDFLYNFSHALDLIVAISRNLTLLPNVHTVFNAGICSFPWSIIELNISLHTFRGQKVCTENWGTLTRIGTRFECNERNKLGVKYWITFRLGWYLGWIEPGLWMAGSWHVRYNIC